MSDTPPSPPPRRTETQQALPQASNVGALRVVTILVMIVSILGLIGTGICFLGFASDLSADEVLGILLLIVPVLLFFAGAVWVCKALLDRLKK